MGREIYDIINDMAEVLNASQMQKLQEVLVKRLSENTVSDYLQTTNMDFLDMFLTAKHLEGCSDKTIRYYRCNIEKMLDTINIPVIKITTEMLRKYLVEYQTINKTAVIVKDTIPDEKIEKVHPHKFRRTMATRAIEKGMPIEQVQKILGHEQIDTTLRYAMVNQNNVKLSHRKYIS